MFEDVSRALSMGRRAAESRMLDMVDVSREGGEVWDEDMGQYVPGLVSVYSGKARIKHAGIIGRDVEAGSHLLTVGQVEVHVPVGAALFSPGDRVRVTVSPTRPDQVGRDLYVVGPFDGSQTTSVRYRVESVNVSG